MKKPKLKVGIICAWILGAVCLLAIVAWLVLFLLAGGNLFAIRPVWLGFLLIAIAGISMTAACVCIYFNMIARERERNSFSCPKCGEICEVGNRFCSHCGASLQESE